MNERIKQLYIQTANETADGKEWAIGGMNNAERFAQLIVRDCWGIVNRHEYSYHEADPLWETAQLIKEHFGVEE